MLFIPVIPEQVSPQPESQSEMPEAIAALVRDAVAVGAYGFSTSRLLMHRDPEGSQSVGCRRLIRGLGHKVEDPL